MYIREKVRFGPNCYSTSPHRRASSIGFEGTDELTFNIAKVEVSEFVPAVAYGGAPGSVLGGGAVLQSEDESRDMCTAVGGDGRATALATTMDASHEKKSKRIRSSLFGSVTPNKRGESVHGGRNDKSLVKTAANYSTNITQLTSGQIGSRTEFNGAGSQAIGDATQFEIEEEERRDEHSWEGRGKIAVNALHIGSGSRKRKFVFNDPDFWLHKGQVLKGKGDLEGAIKCYEEGLQRDEAHVPLIFNLASSYYMAGQFAKAKENFAKAFRNKKDFKEAMFGISLCAFKLNSYQESLAYIQRAIEQDRENAKREGKLEQIQTDVLQYHYLKALCNKQMKNYKAAEEDYEPVLKEVRR